MGIKLKRSNPLSVWLAFFIGINLFAGSILFGVYLINYSDNIMESDHRDTWAYRNAIKDRFVFLVEALGRKDSQINDDNANITYFGCVKTSKENGELFVKTNSKFSDYKEALEAFTGNLELYDYILSWDGNEFKFLKDNLELPADDSVYSELLSNYSRTNFVNGENFKVVIAVNKNLSQRYGAVYAAYEKWLLLKAAVGVDALALIISIILLIISVWKSEARREFSGRLARLSSRVWVEFKLLISAILISLLSDVHNKETAIIILVLSFWWAYLILIDMYTNKSMFFNNNSFSWFIRLYRRYESKKQFQKAMLLRILLTALIEAFLIFIVFYLTQVNDGAAFALLFTGLGVYLFYRYMKFYTEMVTDIGKVVDHVALIRSGDLNTKLALKTESDMFSTAENLNHIQEGIHKSALEQIKSERMKIELITNVSHDLKTPMTSIVNYIDLLSKEELTPDYANDYVKVLSKKAARLTALTQDLFDISKAQSGNLELNIEKIDIVELIKQSIAEMDEKIKESGLNFRVSLPEHKVYINADGRKLYRVFENLISNILKYSLPNTRVYIDMVEEENSVSLAFKNISGYEMNIHPDDLMERFVRGDKARSTEGSGLGLAIAQSFVSLCGGELKISVDGDLFKAIVSFRKV